MAIQGIGAARTCLANTAASPNIQLYFCPIERDFVIGPQRKASCTASRDLKVAHYSRLTASPTEMRGKSLLKPLVDLLRLQCEEGQGAAAKRGCSHILVCKASTQTTPVTAIAVKRGRAIDWVHVTTEQSAKRRKQTAIEALCGLL